MPPLGWLLALGVVFHVTCRSDYDAINEYCIVLYCRPQRRCSINLGLRTLAAGTPARRLQGRQSPPAGPSVAAGKFVVVPIADDCRLMPMLVSDAYVPRRNEHVSLHGPTAALVTELV